MQQYIGIDLHKSKLFITRVNGRGRILEQVEVAHASGELKQYLTRLPRDSRLAVEATGNWMWLYELIEDRCPDIVLAHPLRTKAIASARIKTDKIDATTLAQLCRADLVPAAYIPPRAVRDTRELLRYRASLVRLRTLTHLTEEIGHVTQQIEAEVAVTPQAQLLCTLPGIAAYSALLILSESGDVHRFPDSQHLCSYAGLVPSVHASGGKTRLGRLTKQGSRWLRWILVEQSVHAINGAPQFRRLYDRVAKKHGRNVGRVAVARAMLKTIYAMLTHQEAFRPITKEAAG